MRLPGPIHLAAYSRRRTTVHLSPRSRHYEQAQIPKDRQVQYALGKKSGHVKH